MINTFRERRARRVGQRSAFDGRGARSGGNFTPDAAYIMGLAPVGWYRFGKGITVTGAGVSTWADASGLGHDMLQITDALRPALQADGSILFDGVDNVLTSTFTYPSPVTWYMLLNPLAWTGNDRLLSGMVSTVVLLQSGVSPATVLFCTGAAASIPIPLGSYQAIAAVFNGASSVFQTINASATGDPGSNDPGGVAIGATNGGANAANIQVKEVILYAGAHSAATRAAVLAYLGGV